jgi:hypothetical protein
LRRENEKPWLFESTKAELSKDAATYSASYAGLTRLRGRSLFVEAKARVSITLRKSLTKRMDCRVKPGNDENLVSRARCGILHAASQNRDPGFFFESQATGAVSGLNELAIHDLVA